VQTTARTNGLEVKMHNASTPGELDAAFGAIAAQHPDGRDEIIAFAKITATAQTSGT
jgi:hypothetical protein